MYVPSSKRDTNFRKGMGTGKRRYVPPKEEVWPHFWVVAYCSGSVLWVFPMERKVEEGLPEDKEWEMTKIPEAA